MTCAKFELTEGGSRMLSFECQRRHNAATEQHIYNSPIRVLPLMADYVPIVYQFKNFVNQSRH